MLRNLCQGHVRVMSGHIEISSGSFLGHFKVMKESCQLAVSSIVKFTRRLETEGFSVLFSFNHINIDNIGMLFLSVIGPATPLTNLF